MAGPKEKRIDRKDRNWKCEKGMECDYNKCRMCIQSRNSTVCELETGIERVPENNICNYKIWTKVKMGAERGYEKEIYIRGTSSSDKQTSWHESQPGKCIWSAEKKTDKIFVICSYNLSDL